MNPGFQHLLVILVFRAFAVDRACPGADLSRAVGVASTAADGVLSAASGAGGAAATASR